MPGTPTDSLPAGTKLVAGETCLDFANTADWHASNRPIERLRTYDDLVAWSRCAGLLDAAAATGLLTKAGKRPREAAAVLKRALAVREAIYGLALSILRRRPPGAAALSRLNRELGPALRNLQLVAVPGGLVWDWDRGGRGLDAVLWPILRSAAELFTSERRGRIGQCADDRGCGWLFLDTTKNRSRRWCEMEDCGNRAKARRHYRRRRAREAAGGDKR